MKHGSPFHFECVVSTPGKSSHRFNNSLIDDAERCAVLRCPRNLVNGLQMGFNLIMNGVYWGYNPTY